ncbi:MAG: type II secretion system protein GspC [Candidatus Binataceae bacterium]
MELGFSERYLAILNFALIALLAYVAALCVNHLIASRFAGNGEIAEAPAISVRRHAAAYSRASYDAIVKRDIFNLVPRKTVRAAPAPIARDLHIKLLGTSHATRAKPFAIVEDQQTGTQALYRPGDIIPNAGRVTEIRRSSIIIDRNGKLVTLKMPESLLGASASSSSRAGPNTFSARTSGPAGGISQVSPDRYVISRTSVDQNLQNMAQLFTQIRAVPNLDNGQTNGFRLSEIQPGSVFQQIGLHDGDVLVNVNGQELNDPARALQIFSQLRDSNSISLEVLRNGHPIALNYKIR